MPDLKRFLPPRLPQVGHLPYLWLAYLGIFYLPYAFKPVGARDLGIAAAATLVFLVLYFRSFLVQGRALWLTALGLSLLGMAVAPFNSGASVFFTYSACASAGFSTPRQGWKLIGANIALAGLAGLILQPAPGFWIPAMAFPVVVGVPVLYMSAFGRQQAALLRKQEEVEHLAQLAERERIARDMHDVLGHSLSVIALKSELARKLAPRDPEAAAREIGEVEHCAREALAQVRQAIAGYRSAGLDFEIQQARKHLQAAQIRVDTRLAPVALSTAQENVLALGLREAVTNILRHARASHCQLLLAGSAEGVRLEIRDDGDNPPAEPGNGLKGMRERLESLGGRLLVEPLAPGFRLSLCLPPADSLAKEIP